MVGGWGWEMTDEQALLASIIANPDDDAPRLIYADFIEETGIPSLVARARFIRLQIADGMTRSALSSVIVDDEAGDLLSLHGDRWLDNSRGAVHVRETWRWIWSRGFLHTVRMIGRIWMSSHKSLTDRHPIRKVVLTGPGQDHGRAFQARWGIGPPITFEYDNPEVESEPGYCPCCGGEVRAQYQDINSWQGDAYGSGIDQVYMGRYCQSCGWGPRVIQAIQPEPEGITALEEWEGYMGGDWYEGRSG